MKKFFLNTRTMKRISVGFVALFLCVGALTTVLKINPSDLIASAVSAIHTPPVILFFTPYDSGKTLAVGDTATIDLDINATVPINAMGVSIIYPQDSLEVVSLSKERSFLNLWTQDTTLKEGIGELDFSGGTTQSGGVTGTSTALTLTVRAKKAGSATISVDNVEVLAADNKGTALENASRSITFDIDEPPPPSAGSGSIIAAAPRPTPPSPDLNGDGRVSILDVSLMIVHLVMPYDSRYDLNMDGSVGLPDLSILFSKM
jgi:hypothetical protein